MNRRLLLVLAVTPWIIIAIIAVVYFGGIRPAPRLTEQEVFATINADLGGGSMPLGDVTMASYNRISNGMSYDEAKAILGPGEEMTRSTIAGIDGAIYSWKNSDGSNIMLQFQNDKLIQKAQFGLK